MDRHFCGLLGGFAVEFNGLKFFFKSSFLNKTIFKTFKFFYILLSFFKKNIKSLNLKK